MGALLGKVALVADAGVFGLERGALMLPHVGEPIEQLAVVLVELENGAIVEVAPGDEEVERLARAADERRGRQRVNSLP